MIEPLDLGAEGVAARVVAIQLAAYAVEAELVGFDSMPPLHESEEDVRALVDMCWLGAFEGSTLVAIVGWTGGDRLLDIDRLAVDPAFARRGWGRRLIEAVPASARTVVSTGSGNLPAKALYEGLGFVVDGETEVEPGFFITHYRR